MQLNVSFHGLCRYVVYLESLAWSTNGRHKFSCGCVVISNKMGYYEFFTRALKPGVHYVEVDPDNLCDDIVHKVSNDELHASVRNTAQVSLPPPDAIAVNGYIVSGLHILARTACVTLQVWDIHLCEYLQVKEMNTAIDDSVAVSSSQSAARNGLGLETTNQRSVSSVLSKSSGINPQQIADAGQQVCTQECACFVQFWLYMYCHYSLADMLL